MNPLSENRIVETPFYRATGSEREIFEHCYSQRLPLLLKGPTGTGKSRFVEHMAAKLGRELITVSCHEEMSAVDLIGRYLIQGHDTVWTDGPLTKAIRRGAIVYLDEIAEARPDTIVVLHSLTDHRRVLFLDRHDEVIEAPASFMLVASYNPGYQRGFKELKPSTKQRFVCLSFGYPKAETEIEILCGETGIDSSRATKLVKLAAKIRNLVELGLSESVSTRLLVDAAKLMQSGLSPRTACQVAIAQPRTDEEDTTAALTDMIALLT